MAVRGRVVGGFCQLDVLLLAETLTVVLVKNTETESPELENLCHAPQRRWGVLTPGNYCDLEAIPVVESFSYLAVSKETRRNLRMLITQDARAVASKSRSRRIKEARHLRWR